MPSLFLLTLIPIGSILSGYAPLLWKVTLMVSPTSAQMTGPRDKERIIIPWYVPYRIYKMVIFFDLSSDKNHCEQHAYLHAANRKLGLKAHYQFDMVRLERDVQGVLIPFQVPEICYYFYPCQFTNFMSVQKPMQSVYAFLGLVCWLNVCYYQESGRC